MPVPWTDSLKVGDTEIDSQHEELFRQVNLLLEMTETICLTKCVIQLFRHTREHFSHEEDLMRRIRYPEIRAHLNAHNHLLTQLNELAERIACETFVKTDWLAFFHAWLIDHIETSDRALLAYIRDHAEPYHHFIGTHSHTAHLDALRGLPTHDHLKPE